MLDQPFARQVLSCYIFERYLKESRRETWVTLVHLDRAIGQVRCELSRPSKMDEYNHIAEWSERILLPNFDVEIGADINLNGGNGGPDGGEEIDIDVRRRS